MKTKKVLSMILALVLVVSAFTACAAPSTTSEASKTGESKAADASNTAESSVAVESTTTTDPVSTELKPCRIVQPGILPTDYETGIKAINEKIAADGVGIEVEIIRIPWDAYAEKLNLMLTTGEEFEILHVMQDVKNLSSIITMDAIVPVDDLVAKYPDLQSKFTELEWNSTLFNGKKYAVPDAWTSFDRTMGYVTYRTDIAKKVGYDALPNKVDEVIDLMEKSQAAILEENGLKAYSWLHQNQDTAHWLHRSYDTYPFYVENSLGLILARQDGTIDSFYESEEFKKDATTYAKMYEKGLVNPDVLNLDSQKKYDDAKFGAMLPSQTFDANQQISIKENTGIDAMTSSTIFNSEKPDMIYTFGQNMNAISATANDPETGLKFFDWLYRNKENHDLFHNGIEGTHYKKIGEDRFEKVKGEDGKAIFELETWMTGYVPYIRFDSQSTDEYIDNYQYKSKNYVISPIAGFNFDSSTVTAELTNLQIEIIASIYPIKIGMISYEENIGPAIEKLKAAGLEKYLTEYRKQFKAYLEANPKVLEDAKATKK